MFPSPCWRILAPNILPCGKARLLSAKHASASAAPFLSNIFMPLYGFQGLDGLRYALPIYLCTHASSIRFVIPAKVGIQALTGTARYPAVGEFG
jgi:hypothetical protein